MTADSEVPLSELQNHRDRSVHAGFDPNRWTQQLQAAGVGKFFKDYSEALERSGVMALHRSLEKMNIGTGDALHETQVSHLALGKALERFTRDLPLQGSALSEIFRGFNTLNLERIARDLGQTQRIGEALRQSGSPLLNRSVLTGKTRLSKLQAGLASLGLQDEQAQAKAVEGITQELLNRQKAEPSGPRIVELEGAAVIQIQSVADMVVASRSESAASTVAEPIWANLPTVVLLLILSALLNLPMAAVGFVTDWDDIRNGLVDLNERLPQTESMSELRHYIRTELASKPGDVRIVSGWDVALRAEPSMKSEVILRLPYQEVVKVLGKEDRTWLYVSYLHKDYVITGYVSTRYLKKARR